MKFIAHPRPQARIRSASPSAPRIIIIGAGLAGIAASAALTDRGSHTILLERRGLLGGRATSFFDAATDTLLDNCQHVLLGCCTELLKLYRRLGTNHEIEFFDTIHFADQTGRRADLCVSALPSPLHLAPSMLRFGLLSLADKSQIARTLLAMKLLCDSGRRAVAQQTFADWLRDHGQSQSAIDRFWNVIITSALNEDVSRAGAGYGIQVFQQAFLGDRAGYRMGLPAVPLAELYRSAVASDVRTNARVVALLGDGRVAGVRLATGEDIFADAILLATAPDAAERLLESAPARLQPSLADLRRRIGQLEHSPILGIHLWFDRPVMDLPHLALIGTRLQWLFRKDSAGRHLHAVISAAREFVDWPEEKIAALCLAEMARILPGSAAAQLLRIRVIKEKRATFSPVPDVDALRPGQGTGVAGLYLAGDYTQTDWPATMEGAVRSGLRAAEAIVRGEGKNRRGDAAKGMRR
ncbi:MAG TPA: hydroxysqualene dehydroxylase HpnE [Tepidisphaeraceae bacterium]|jgi:zeta-carotene desaturase